MLPTNGPVLQNSVTALWRGAHLNMWKNQDLDTASGRRGKFNEVDFEAGYERSLEKAGFSAGVIRYTFPNTPAVKAYFDVDGIRGTYVTFDLSHSVAMPKLRLQVSWSVGLGVPVSFGKRWRLTPRLSYAVLARGAPRQSGVPSSHGFVGGLALGFTY